MIQNTPSDPPLPSTRHEKLISGATLGETEDLPPDPLPMTLWLRGDESYCESFSLDADGVMERLGIKRTRLTQISGRELRVGRIKRGRYIVPVYRPDDVEQYLSWSRATATHLKSTQAVTEATENLKDQTAQLFQKTETLLQNLSDTMAEDLLSRVAHPLAQLLVQGLAPPIQGEIQHQLKNLSPLIDHLENTLDQQMQQAAWRIAEQQNLLQRTLGSRLESLTGEVTAQLKSSQNSHHHHQAASLLLLERTADILALLSTWNKNLEREREKEKALNLEWTPPKPLALKADARRLRSKNISLESSPNGPTKLPLDRYKARSRFRISSIK